MDKYPMEILEWKLMPEKSEKWQEALLFVDLLVIIICIYVYFVLGAVADAFTLLEGLEEEM